MHFYSIVSRYWKTNFKTVIGILSLFAIVLILPRPVDAFQTALVRATDGNVYQIRFPNGDLNGRYSISDFIDNFFIYNETGEVKLCPGIDEPVTRELYTAAWVLANTPRNTPLFDTSALNDALIETAADIGIDQEGNVKVQEILREITEEMIVDELQGKLDQLLSTIGTPVSIDLRTLEIKYKNPLEIISEQIAANTDEPLILAKSVEFLRRLMEPEIEYHGMMYAFAKANEYAITARTLQRLGNYRAAALWDAINAGDVVDITGITFIIVHEESVEISDNIGVFDPWGLRLAAQVYQDYAERAGELGTDVGKNPEVLETVLIQTQPINMIKQLLLAIGSAQDVIELKDTVDQLEVQLPNDVKRKLHENIIGIYNSASSDLTAHGFCAPDLRFTAIPPTVPEGDTLTYTVSLNSAPAFVGIITISSNNPDVSISPTSLTFTPNNWYIPKSVVVDVSVDADSIDESVSLKHIVVGYGGGMVREFRFDITDHVRNQAPQRVNEIPAQSLTIGSASPPLELSTYFHDPDGDQLLYAAESSDKTVATTQRTGSQLTILPRGIGTAIITVTAGNSDDTFATQTFTVTVTAEEAPSMLPTSQDLNIGDSIIVQNTGSLGLNVRSDPEVRNQNPDNRIGKVYDGAIGIIVSGTNPDAVGRTWWEIEWDTSDKVQWQRQPTNQRGWSVEAIGEVGLLARQPSAPVTQSFDLAIQSLSVSKNTLDPGESFTLSVTIHNNGPGNSPGPTLSYYHSSDLGFSPTDPPQLQGTVSLSRLASGESTTQLIQLAAPSTPKTYYYGAWLAANTGDTNLNNNYATEVGVTVTDTAVEIPDDTIETSELPDVVVENVSVDSDRMFPEERFTVSATVRNAGGRRASNVRLRFYRSSDAIYSTDDVEIEDVSEFIGGLDADEAADEDAHFDAPSEQGVYYYIARVERVRNERNTDNNYAAAKITVLPPAAPDYVVSLSANRYLVDPGRYVRLDAIVRNQGEENSRHTTTVRFYRSLDPSPSSDDEEIGTDTIRALRDGRTDDGVENGPAPTEPGTYYFYACVDSVPDERNTNNNCSNVVTINVRGPDLVVHSVSVDYHSRTNTVYPEGIFDLDVTVRNQGTDDADDSTLRYYISSDPILSSDDTEVATDYVYSLDMNETSKTYKEKWIRVPYTSGFFYALVCVDSVEDEIDTDNNCYTPIKITVRNFRPRAEGTIPVQTLSVGTPVSVDISAYFVDPNNDNLTYTASSSDPNIVTVSVSGAQVTLTPHRTGSVNVTVTASDNELSATQTFTVSIEGEEAWMPDANLRRIVRTALGLAQNDALTQQAMEGLIILNAASSTAGTGVQNITGLERATQLTILNLGRTGVRDLTPLQELTQLTQLNLIYTEISDLTPLQELTNLTHLDLLQTRVRNISPIQGLNNLTTLNLERLNIRDLTPLQGLTALTSLNLSFNNLTDLTMLSGLTALTSLSLGHTSISDITPLGGLTALTYLDLKNNQIRDIAPVSGLTQLVTLYLDGNQISDASPLETLTSLKFLRLQYNPIADTAPLQRLKEKNPNVSIDVDIETQSPDLFVDSVRVNKTTVAPSETFRLDAVIKNGGEADASAITVRYYQSTDESISTTDTELNTGTLRLITVDGMKEPWAQLTAPDTPGVYYYGICVDEIAGENDTTNNCSIGIPVTVLGADLRVNSVRVNTTTTPLGEKSRLTIGVKDRGEADLSDNTDRSALSTVAPGEQFRVDVSIQNRGKANSTATTLRYYLSSDETITSEDMEVHTATLQSIAAEAMREPSVQLTAPDTPGTYYYGVCVDEVADESDTTNNCSTAVAVTVENTGSADFVVESINANKTTVKPGENFQISVVIGNQGEIDATATVLRFYLSTDETISTADTEVQTATLPIITADATRQQSRQFTAPNTPDTYYYGVCVDAMAGESDTSNNCSVAVAITVGGADLMIDSTPQVSKTTLSPGETFQINTRVWNQGSATSDVTTLRYYLSTDETISSEDTEVDSERVAALSPKGAHASRRRADISKTLTAPDTAGVHYYGVCVDAVSGDANTGNNCSQAIAITVEAPEPEPVVSQVIDETQATDPGDLQGPDLVFSMARVDNATIRVGGGVRFHITIQNQGTRATPTTMIRYYRSSDATISAEDTELRAMPVGAIGRGKSVTTWALLPSATSVGTYYYGACVDGVASEFDTSNNCSDAIEITVKLQSDVKPELRPVGTISTQELEVDGSPVVLNVSDNFFGKVERYTASSNKTGVVTVSMSESEVTLTPIGEGWATVTIEASSGDLVAKQTFSVSVGGAAVPEPDPVVTPEPEPEPEIEGPDLSAEVSIPDVNLRDAVRFSLVPSTGPITQQRMTEIREIYAEHSEISDLTGLEHATQLRGLNIRRNQISDLSPLENLTELRFLSLGQSKQISDLNPLKNLVKLTYLEIGSYEDSASPIRNLSPLAGMTALTDLILVGHQIEDISSLAGLTALTKILLHDNQISNVSSLGNLTVLRWLDLTNNQISDISALQNLTALTYLQLDNNQINSITSLSGLTALTSLDLKNNQISDISALQNLTALSTYLNLSDNNIVDITPLEALTVLTQVRLSQNQITDVTPLESMSALRYVTLSGNPIEDYAPLRRLIKNNPALSMDITIPPDPNNNQGAPSAPVVPAETALLSNYPNPFNPETWIPYQLATAAAVTLTVYDVRGVMVRRLELGHRSPGFYYSRGRAAHWDGRNQLGEKVASGLYFYTFTAGDFTATKKLLIRK